MTDKDFLLFIRDRLVHVYNENPNTDFILKLESLALSIDSNGKIINKPNTKIDPIIIWLNNFGIQSVRAENGYYDILNGFSPNIIYDADTDTVSVCLPDGTKTATVFKSEKYLIAYLKTGRLIS